MSCTWPWTWLRYFTSTHRWDSGQTSHVYLTKFNDCTGKNTERTILALPSHDLPSAGAESPSSPCNLSRLSRQVTLLISRGIFLSSNFCPSCWFWNLIPTERSSCIIHSVHVEPWKGVYLKTPLPKELSPSPEKYMGSYRLKQRHVRVHTHTYTQRFGTLSLLKSSLSSQTLAVTESLIDAHEVYILKAILMPCLHYTFTYLFILFWYH